MFTRVALGMLIVVTVGTLSSASQKAGVERLEWISGCWALGAGKEQTEEIWMRPAGQSMIGMSRTVAGGKTVFTEHLQIREVNGEISYIVALGMGSKPVAFRLVKTSDNEAVFENPEHDFPQRIIYRRDSADALFARIEGQENGVDKAMDFRFKKSKCD